MSTFWVAAGPLDGGRFVAKKVGGSRVQILVIRFAPVREVMKIVELIDCRCAVRKNGKGTVRAQQDTSEQSKKFPSL